MVKFTVADPLPPVVPPEVMVAVVPSTETLRAELAAKPWAVILTPAVPTAPVMGVSPVAEAVTVKLVAEVAVLVPSETFTTSPPLGAAGTVKVTVDEPLLPLVPPAVTVAAVPFTVTVRAWLAMKP